MYIQLISKFCAQYSLHLLAETSVDDHYLMMKWKDIESSQDIVIAYPVVAAHITMVKDRANLCNVSDILLSPHLKYLICTT